MRVYKRTVQALWRILIPDFRKFLNSKNPIIAKSMNDSINKHKGKVESEINLGILLKTGE